MPKNADNIQIHPDNYEAINEYFRTISPDPRVRSQTLAAMSRFESGLEVSEDEGAIAEIANLNDDPEKRIVYVGKHFSFFDPVAFAAAVHNVPELNPAGESTFILSKPGVHTMLRIIPPINKEIQKRVESVGSTIIWRPKDIENASDPYAGTFRKIGQTIGLLDDTTEWQARKEEISKRVNGGFSELVLAKMIDGDNPFLYPEGSRAGKNPRKVYAFNKGVGLIVIKAVRADLDVRIVPVGIGYPEGRLGVRSPALHFGTPIEHEWKSFKEVISIAHEATQAATDNAFASLDARAD